MLYELQLDPDKHLSEVSRNCSPEAHVPGAQSNWFLFSTHRVRSDILTHIWHISEANKRTKITTVVWNMNCSEGHGALVQHFYFIFKDKTEECFSQTRIVSVKLRGNCIVSPHTSSQDLRGCLLTVPIRRRDGRGKTKNRETHLPIPPSPPKKSKIKLPRS